MAAAFDLSSLVALKEKNQGGQLPLMAVAWRLDSQSQAGKWVRWALRGTVIKGTCRLMGSSFGPVCCDKGD